MTFRIVLSVILDAMALFLALMLVCFFKVFYSGKRKVLGEDEYEIPEGAAYEAIKDKIIGWTKDIRTLPHENVEITSHDGLTLRGRYYEFKEGAPIEILFHGYRGTAERDMCAGVGRCFAVGRSALIVDQRAAGTSDGHVISFGINERLDCIRWAEYVAKRFGEDTDIILTGISMGAATVMMASAERLPKNVVCILADCGYSSPKEIIKKVVKDMHLPPNVLYPVIRLSARVFGGFDLECTSPVDAVQKTDIPIIFIHGESDSFVPCEMSEELYSVCASEKSLVKIAGAEHGLAYPTDMQKYINALVLFEEVWRRKKIAKSVDK